MLTDPETLYMKTGRPSKHPRPQFGQRLHDLREAAGLSQQQLADKLGMSQRAYSHWERRPVALRPDQLQSLAAALNLPLEALLTNSENKKRGAGPTGKMRRLDVSRIRSLQGCPNKYCRFCKF